MRILLNSETDSNIRIFLVKKRYSIAKKGLILLTLRKLSENY